MRHLIDIIENRLQEGIEPTEYGYWISPEGEIIPVKNQQHGDVIATRGFFSVQSAIMEGWIRVIAYSGWFSAEFRDRLTLTTARTIKKLASAQAYQNYTLDWQYFSGRQKVGDRVETTNKIEFLTAVDTMMNKMAMAESLLLRFENRNLLESFEPSEYGYWINPTGEIISCADMTHGDAAAAWLGKAVDEDDEEQERELVDEALEDGCIRIVASKGSEEFNAEWNSGNVGSEAKRALLEVISLYANRIYFIIQSEYFDEYKKAVRYIREN